jgi:hypothetical protein
VFLGEQVHELQRRSLSGQKNGKCPASHACHQARPTPVNAAGGEFVSTVFTSPHSRTRASLHLVQLVRADRRIMLAILLHWHVTAPGGVIDQLLRSLLQHRHPCELCCNPSFSTTKIFLSAAIITRNYFRNQDSCHMAPSTNKNSGDLSTLRPSS